MKFKRTFSVFVNNFSTTYKLLLYRALVALICAGLCSAVILPFVSLVTGTVEYQALSKALEETGKALTNLELQAFTDSLINLKTAGTEFISALSAGAVSYVWVPILLFVIYLIWRWLSGIGDYSAGALVNDKMALQANSSFIRTMTKNLGRAMLYSLIYTLITSLYDALCIALLYAVFFVALPILPALVKIFLFTVFIMLLVVLKITFTTDWLPAVIYGKKNRQAMLCSFKRKGGEIASVFSNYLIIIIINVTVNVAVTLLTLGAATLITVPAGYLLLIAFQFVNYCDNNGLKYFTDANTIVKPRTERVPTREEFFKGEND